jgi:hypothetical protein
MTTAEFCGADFESAYATAFGGSVNGGFNDHGLDVLTGVAGIPAVQVKASISGARNFLAESLKRSRFIPLCVGEPGAKEAMIASLRQYGAWVAMDIPGRQAFMEGVRTVRDICSQPRTGGLHYARS